MSEEKAELRAKKVRRSIRKHNEYLIDLTQSRDSKTGDVTPRENFKVASMIEGADPSTEEGRQQILEEYPKKVYGIFKGIVEKSPDGITEEEEEALNKLRDLDPNLSPEEYEKACLDVIHSILRTPSLASGGADLAESLTGLIQTKKGQEIYFPSDVTYKVGDMISLGDIGDLDPTDPDYYNKVADAASSIIVTVEAEGPASVKVGAGAASAAEEKIRMTEYENPKTRSVLNGLVSTHQTLFKTKPQNLTESDKKIQEARDHALAIGVTQEEIDEIDKKAKEQAAKWKELWRPKNKKGTENWTDEDWDKTYQVNLKAPKNKHNAFGNYKYRNLEGIFEGLKPLLEETGCVITISDSIEMLEDRYYIKATAVILKGIESISCDGWARESEDKKGMDLSQITAKYSSKTAEITENVMLIKLSDTFFIII